MHSAAAGYGVGEFHKIVLDEILSDYTQFSIVLFGKYGASWWLRSLKSNKYQRACPFLFIFPLYSIRSITKSRSMVSQTALLQQVTPVGLACHERSCIPCRPRGEGNLWPTPGKGTSRMFYAGLTIKRSRNKRPYLVSESIISMLGFTGIQPAPTSPRKGDIVKNSK